MRSVRKVGLAEDIIPTREEIDTIHSFRRGLITNRIPVYNWDTKEKKKAKLLPKPTQGKRVYIRLKDYRYKIDIPKVNYIAHSKYLSEIMENIYVKGFGYSLDRIVYLWGSDFDDPNLMFMKLLNIISLAENEPIKLSILGSNQDWIYKGVHYSTSGPYTDEEFKILIMEEFDKERRKFERLKRKFSTPGAEEASRSRPSIPESVRIQVWRRDGGRCAKCGSRENLEYDHIIPLSKGGSNTTRNIELLCEKCNRAKSDKIE